MKQVKFIITVLSIAIALLCLNTRSFAAGTRYVSAQIGTGEIDTGSRTIFNSTKTKGIGYRIATGYLFKITPQFSIGPELNLGEAPYVKMSSSDNTSETSFSESFGFVAKAMYQFTNRFYATSKLGIANTTQKTDVSIGMSISATSTLPTFSLGAGFRFNKKLSVDINYNQIFGEDNTLKKYASSDTAKLMVASVTTYMLGFNYAF